MPAAGLHQDEKAQRRTPGGGRSRRGAAIGLVCHLQAMPPGSVRGLILATEDLMADYDRLLTKGVDFEQPPKDEPWCVDAVFRDPDGNRLILRQQNALL
jgi:predicted enzyme related to lactoylglutathione lyase